MVNYPDNYIKTRSLENRTNHRKKRKLTKEEKESFTSKKLLLSQCTYAS
jgi:hypothetical protein